MTVLMKMIVMMTAKRTRQTVMTRRLKTQMRIPTPVMILI